MGTGRKARQAQSGTATGRKVGQVQQVGAKGRKVGHVTGTAGGCGQGWESKHFVAIAYVDIAHCGIGMARAGQ